MWDGACPAKSRGVADFGGMAPQAIERYDDDECYDDDGGERHDNKHDDDGDTHYDDGDERCDDGDERYDERYDDDSD